MKFEDLLGNFGLQNISLDSFLLNGLLATLLSWIVAIYYQRYGSSVSNRSQFAANFVLLTLTTMLIITIVKSSIALSLGLVGALSIVRFRAAIKDPEELIYLFLVIAIGLGMGADQPQITIVGFLLIMTVLIINRGLRGKRWAVASKTMQLSITSQHTSVEIVNDILIKHFDVVDLKRLSQDSDHLYLAYTLETKDFAVLAAAKDALLALEPSLEVSFVDTSNVAG